MRPSHPCLPVLVLPSSVAACFPSVGVFPSTRGPAPPLTSISSTPPTLHPRCLSPYEGSMKYGVRSTASERRTRVDVLALPPPSDSSQLAPLPVFLLHFSSQSGKYLVPSTRWPSADPGANKGPLFFFDRRSLREGSLLNKAGRLRTSSQISSPLSPTRFSYREHASLAFGFPRLWCLVHRHRPGLRQCEGYPFSCARMVARTEGLVRGSSCGCCRRQIRVPLVVCTIDSADDCSL